MYVQRYPNVYFISRIHQLVMLDQEEETVVFQLVHEKCHNYGTNQQRPKGLNVQPGSGCPGAT